MSIKLWLKGMKRRAARRGLGRQHGNVSALLDIEAQPKPRKRKGRK